MGIPLTRAFITLRVLLAQMLTDDKSCGGEGGGEERGEERRGEEKVVTLVYILGRRCVAFASLCLTSSFFTFSSFSSFSSFLSLFSFLALSLSCFLGATQRVTELEKSLGITTLTPMSANNPSSFLTSFSMFVSSPVVAMDTTRDLTAVERMRL